jgi:dolichyl-phosphate-mannose--protein O-mannosyl transferase
VTALAAVTRFWALGFPTGKSFDEVYYAVEAQELLRYGYEDNRDYMFIVHPPLGKWCIALTSWIFGDNALGWRMAPAIAGTASVLILVRVAQRMFRSVLLGVLAGVLLSLDGISLVMSRVALLDIFLQTFILAGFAALVIDRDQMRGRLGELYAAGVDLTRGVPSLGPRPWRLAGGVLLGLACAVKWSALSYWLGFALLSLFWDRGALKAAGVEQPWLAWIKRSAPAAVLSLGASAVVAYLLTWTGWFVGENSWNRHWSDTHPGTGLFGWLPGGLRSLLNYHHEAYKFHSHLYDPHAYKANPWSWLILGRPISFYAPPDVKGCGAADCTREILLIGTPIMYWAFVPAVLWCAWRWLTTRDWRAGSVLMACLVGWGVWLQNQRRTGFLFYMTPLMPYLVIGLTLAVGTMLARAPEDSDADPVIVGGSSPHPSGAASDDHVADEDSDVVREVGLLEWIRLRGIPLPRLLRTAAVVLWLGAVVADFVWMWPIYTGGMLTHAQWVQRMWFPSWI